MHVGRNIYWITARASPGKCHKGRDVLNFTQAAHSQGKGLDAFRRSPRTQSSAAAECKESMANINLGHKSCVNPFQVVNDGVISDLLDYLTHDSRSQLMDALSLSGISNKIWELLYSNQRSGLWKAYCTYFSVERGLLMWYIVSAEIIRRSFNESDLWHG